MRALLKTSDILERLCAVAARLGAWMIVPLILVIVFDVATRKFPAVHLWMRETGLYAYASPTRLQELEWHLHAVVFLLAFGATYLRNGHVRVDMWREGRSPRTRAWVELAGLLALAVPYCAVMLYFGWVFVRRSYLSGEGSPAMTGLPNRWIIKSFLLIGMVLLAAALVATILRLVVFLFGHGPAAAAAQDRLGMLGQGDPARAP